MKKTIILWFVILFSLDMRVFAAGIEKIDDFEAIGSYFSVPDYSKKATAEIEYDEQYVAEGVHSFKIDFDTINEAKQEKVAITAENNYDLSGAKKFIFDVFNPGDKSIKAAIGISTGANWEWQESEMFEIKPGWSKGLSVDLTAQTFKTEKNGWKNISALRRLDDTQRITFHFYSGKGPLYLDYVRIEKGEKTMEKNEVTYKYFSTAETAVKSFEPATKEGLKTGEIAEFVSVINGNYRNAFDNSAISAVLEAKNLSTGAVVKVPGFFDGWQDNKEGDGLWRFRFTPAEPGNYEVKLLVSNNGKNISSAPLSISVAGKTADSCLKVSADKRHFEFSGTGKGFLGIGSSVGWARGVSMESKDSFEYYFRKLSAAGANTTRVWMTDFALGIEWSEPTADAPDYGGIMQYSLKNSEKLDHVFELAKKYNMYVILTLGSYSELKEDPGMWKEERWKYNPYNILNGGTCNTPADYFTDEKARAAYKNRLNYIIARWGHSPYLLAYDIWNEVKAPAAWISEMAKNIKEKDAGRHMVSTTYGDANVYKIPEIDFSMSHIYGWQGKQEDLTARLIGDAQSYTSDYDKPYFAEELGIDAGKSDLEYDKDGKGVNVHNSLWASVMSNSCSTQLSWWWKEYIDAKNMYKLFPPLKKFFDGINISAGWKPAQISAVSDGARVIGLQAGNEVLLWCQNMKSDWYNSWKAIEPQAIPVKCKITGVADGAYKVIFYDTWDGTTIKEAALQAKQGVMEINISKLKKDLAIKITK